jgi:hypothetical protein
MTLNLHSRSGEFNYHSEIFADKAGYNVYLPATFIYKFDANKFPDSVEFKTGEGFKLDRKNNKIFTKYPSGVAIMQIPFFLTAHFYCKLTNPEIANGYSRPYHYAIDIAAVFYGLIGLVFIFLVLIEFVNKKIALLSILLFLLGTNLFYYITKETGLSHVYSFCLMSVGIYELIKLKSNSIFSQWNLIKLAIIIGFIFLVRPINIVFLPIFLFIKIKNSTPILTHLKQLKLYSYIVFFITIGLTITPQIIFNLYLFNSPFAYSYGEEGFPYLLNPQFQHVLFSFENGLLAMNPLHFFTLAGMYLLILKRENGWLSLILFSGITYLYSSWWSPQLGCGLGHRGFVEFYSIFILAFTELVNKVYEFKNKFLKIFIFSFIIVLICINLKISYTYDGCWYGKTIWDISEIKRLIIS